MKLNGEGWGKILTPILLWNNFIDSYMKKRSQPEPGWLIFKVILLLVFNIIINDFFCNHSEQTYHNPHTNE